MTAQAAQSPECRNLIVLCERVLTTREPVMLNDPGTHELLSGHSVANTFLALPIDRGKQLLGIVGLAKRSEDMTKLGSSIWNHSSLPVRSCSKGFTTVVSRWKPRTR